MTHDRPGLHNLVSATVSVTPAASGIGSFNRSARSAFHQPSCAPAASVDLGLVWRQPVRMMMIAQSIQGALEVVQDNGVAQALEDKRQLWQVSMPAVLPSMAAAYLPEWLDPRGVAEVIASQDGECVHNPKDNGNQHEQEHDAEPWTDADQLHQRAPVPPLNGVQEEAGGEDPPWVPIAQSAPSAMATELAHRTGTAARGVE